MGVAVLDGYLYVVGGTNKQNEVLQSVERYSFVQVSPPLYFHYVMTLGGIP